ncbi:MAG: hypothetical protein ACI3XQ_03580 [Eubacteriales bacterium]
MKKLLSLMSAIILVLLSVVSCADKTPDVKSGSDADHSEESVVPTTEESAEIPDGYTALIIDSQARFRIICPYGLGTDVKRAVNSLCAEIARVTGVEAQWKFDDENTEDVAEILIGSTNRSLSASLTSGLVGSMYGIASEDGKTAVCATDSASLTHAINYFTKTYLTDAKEAAGQGYWFIPTEIDIISEGVEKYNEAVRTGKEIDVITEKTGMSQVEFTTSRIGGYTLRWVQGGCTDGKYLYQCMITPETSEFPEDSRRVVILKFDIETGQKVAQSAPFEKFGHANDMTYNPNIGKIVVVGKDGYRTVSIIDPESLEAEEEYALPKVGYNIAYSTATGQYIIGTSENLYFYSTTFSLEKTVSIKQTDGYAGQGMACDSMYIYRLEYKQNFYGSGTGDFHVSNLLVICDYSGKTVATVELGGSDRIDCEIENISLCGEYIYVGANARSWRMLEVYRVKLINN